MNDGSSVCFKSIKNRDGREKQMKKSEIEKDRNLWKKDWTVKTLPKSVYKQTTTISYESLSKNINFSGLRNKKERGKAEEEKEEGNKNAKWNE